MDSIISEFKNLSDRQQKELLGQLNEIASLVDFNSVLQSHGDMLDNKGGECPHCGEFHYSKFGTDKGLRRYKCLECNRTFTEHTGTWISGIHNKALIPEFLKTMELELSILKSSKKLKLDPCTVFEWRHKFLSSIEIQSDVDFKGITETDETFFLESQKGKKCVDRKPRERGGGAKRGISNEQAAVITVMDRCGNSEFIWSNMGRISEQDIERAFGHRIGNRTVLCSDGHNSYKAFSNTHDIEHHIINASKGEHVKGIFHIQHINSLHSRLKFFFDYDRKGVSTKYLQKYLNWQKIKDMFKDTTQWIKTVLLFSLKQQKALKIFDNILKDYKQIYFSTQFPN